MSDISPKFHINIVTKDTGDIIILFVIMWHYFFEVVVFQNTVFLIMSLRMAIKMVTNCINMYMFFIYGFKELSDCILQLWALHYSKGKEFT